jgi:hypothetical protein
MTTTKTSGLGWTTLTVQDASGTAQDIRTDNTNLSFSTPRGVQDITGIDKSAHERLLLLADFSIELDGVFDPGANMAHDVFKTVSSTSVIRQVVIAVAGADLTVNCLFSDYAITRAAAGELTWKAPGALADGTVPTWTGA